MENKVELTSYQQIPSSAHILYLYDDEDLYVENMMSYIKSGIERGHHVIIIENSLIFKKAKRRIKTLFTPEEQTLIHHYENHSFYGKHSSFQISKIVEHFNEVLNPLIKNNITARTWAHVEWKEQEGIESALEEFEKEADCQVNGMELISLCAYNAEEVPALLQTAMMKSHEYLMTDYELVKSSFYKNKS